MIRYGKERQSPGVIRDATQKVVQEIPVGRIFSSSYIAGEVFGHSTQRAGYVRKVLESMQCVEKGEPEYNINNRPVSQYTRVIAPTTAAPECAGCHYAHRPADSARQTCLIYVAALDESD